MTDWRPQTHAEAVGAFDAGRAVVRPKTLDQALAEKRKAGYTEQQLTSYARGWRQVNGK